MEPYMGLQSLATQFKDWCVSKAEKYSLRPSEAFVKLSYLRAPQRALRLDQQWCCFFTWGRVQEGGLKTF